MCSAVRKMQTTVKSPINERPRDQKKRPLKGGSVTYFLCHFEWPTNMFESVESSKQWFSFVNNNPTMLMNRTRLLNLKDMFRQLLCHRQFTDGSTLMNNILQRH